MSVYKRAEWGDRDMMVLVGDEEIDDASELLTSEEARELAARLLACADEAERQRDMTRPDPPRLPVIPLFEELLTIPQLRRSRAACVVYGVIAAYHAQGHQPTLSHIAQATWRTSSERDKPTKRAVLLLERVGMLRRVRKAQNNVRFELLGPVM